MSVTFDDLPALMRQTLRDPAGAAQVLTARRFAMPVLITALLLVAVLSSLSVELTFMLTDSVAEEGPAAFPIPVFVMLVAVFQALFAACVVWGGRPLGGRGDFPEMLAMLIWAQMMAVLIQMVQLLTLLILPPLVGVVTIAGLGLMIYFMVHFVNVVHRFDSLMKALGAIALGMVLLSFLMVVVIMLLGGLNVA